MKLSKNFGILIASSGLFLSLCTAVAYLYFFLAGYHPCGVLQFAIMVLGSLMVLVSWHISQARIIKLMRHVTGGIFFLTALLDVALYPQDWSPGFLISFIAAGLVVLTIPYKWLAIDKVVTFGLSVSFTLVLVGVVLELALHNDYIQEHVLGVYGTPPPHLQPTLNSKGYRDGEHSLKKPAEVTRILILGDSFTYGYRVADNEAYPRSLADLAGPNIEIITLAKPGWSTFDELTALRQEGLAYEPDIVLVGVFTNDPEPPPDFEYLLLLSEWKICTCIPLDLDVFNFVDYQINRLGAQLGLRDDYVDWEDQLYDPGQPYWSAWQKTVREFGQELKSQNIPAFAVLLAHPVDPRSENLKRKYNLLAQEFEKAGFNTLNLWSIYAEKFADVPYKSLWALPNDTHPGSEIHAFYAREIWKVLSPQITR